MKQSFTSCAESFLRRLRQENYAPSTVESYTSALTRFQTFLLTDSQTDPASVTRECLAAYHAELRASLKEGSVLCMMKVIRQFYRFLEEEQRIFSTPFRSERRPLKRHRNPPENVLSEEEVELLFKEPDLATCKGFRDRVLLELLYCTGLRKAEVVQLDTEDIDLSGGLVYVRQGKGRKDRVVPLTACCADLLKEYLEKVRPVMLSLELSEEALFVSRFGKRFSRNTLTRIIREKSRAAGLRKRVSTHTFRHTFAAHMIKGGARVRYVQEILGHAKLSTTRIYTRVFAADLKKAVKMYHSRENDLYEVAPPPLPDRKTRSGKVMLSRVFPAAAGNREEEEEQEEERQEEVGR